MRAPKGNGSGQLLGRGVPNVAPDAKSARELRQHNELRAADPARKAAHQKATVFGMAKRHAKKSVTLPKLKFMETDNDA